MKPWDVLLALQGKKVLRYTRVQPRWLDMVHAARMMTLAKYIFWLLGPDELCAVCGEARREIDRVGKLRIFYSRHAKF